MDGMKERYEVEVDGMSDGKTEIDLYQHMSLRTSVIIATISSRLFMGFSVVTFEIT